jgi:hypothetical protein
MWLEFEGGKKKKIKYENTENIERMNERKTLGRSVLVANKKKCRTAS